jgi:hypothetical protein
MTSSVSESRAISKTWYTNKPYAMAHDPCIGYHGNLIDRDITTDHSRVTVAHFELYLDSNDM